MKGKAYRKQQLECRRRYDKGRFGAGGFAGASDAERRQTWIRAAAAATAAAYLTYVYTDEPVAGTNRRHNILLPVSFEARLGSDAYGDLRRSIGQRGGEVNPAHPIVTRMDRIVDRLRQKVDRLENVPEHRKNLDFRVTVLDAPDIPNAACLPDGHIVVFTGIFKLLTTDDMMAAVLAHEMAHALARHSAEQISLASAILIPLSILEVLLGIPLDFKAALVNLLVSLPNSRRNEMEADAVGMKLLSMACFQPDAMVQMLQRLESLDEKGMRPPQFLATHPTSKSRKDAARDALPRMRLLAEASDCSSSFNEQFKLMFG